MKTTIELPREMMDEVRFRADHEGREVEEAVAYYLARGLAISPGPPVNGESRISTEPATGLPVIRCFSTAPPRWMTAETLLELEHDTQTLEDLERFGLSSGQ